MFSFLGFYPVCPGTDPYILGAPLFKKVTLNLEGNKKFIISAPENSAKNRFVASQALNGAKYTKTWISHTDLMKGGIFNFQMSAFPNKNRVTSDSDLPYSFSINDRTMYCNFWRIYLKGLSGEKEFALNLNFAHKKCHRF